MIRTLIGWPVRIVLLVALFSAARTDVCAFEAQQFDESRVLEALANGPSAERVSAISAIKKLPVTQRSAPVLAALLQELERLRRQLEDRQFALLSGQPLAPSDDHGEYLFSVLEVVTEHREDPLIIRPLLPFVATGNRVVDTLAGFGEQAVSEVAAVARSGLAPQTDVHSALLVLRRMLERPGRYPISAASKALIAKIAQERLTGTQPATVVMNAIELAVATGDARLLQRVEQLATDPGAVRVLGISDPELVRAVQNKANDSTARVRAPLR
jgi:hypothetical protein